MPVSRGLGRLLRIRTLQEQHSHAELESALGELRLLEQALAATEHRESRGRLLVSSSARSGDLAERMAGLEESRSAARHAASLRPRVVHAEELAAELRSQFLARRIERRQAETLIVEAQMRDGIDAARREQQSLDDAFGLRRARSAPPIAPGKSPGSPSEPKA